MYVARHSRVLPCLTPPFPTLLSSYLVRGIHTRNVGRAAQRGDGPDIFLTDGDDLADRVIAIAGRQPKGALDAVAGTATGRLARCIAATGTLLVYGHLSGAPRSEEHTSELQSLMRISYAVSCLKQINISTPLLCSNTNITSQQ